MSMYYIGGICCAISFVILYCGLGGKRRRKIQCPNAQVVELCPETLDQVKTNMIKRFQEFLRIPSISFSSEELSFNELSMCRSFLESNYPRLHASEIVNQEVVEGYSLLYFVKGSNTKLLPYLMAAHLDVVPIENRAKWDVDPFSADIRNGSVYGRGAMDDKSNVLAVCEAVEKMISRGERPKRGFYMAFGHNEEVKGSGAKAMAELLKERGVRLEYVIDEGSLILRNPIAGVKGPVAIIGVAEKGYATIEFSVKDIPGGHASMPDKESAIGIISRAVSRLEASRQPSMFGRGPEKDTITYMAQMMSPLVQLVVENLWLFGPVIERILQRKPASNALLRTTTAITIIRGGVKDNVLATSASFVVNHRIHPSQPIRSVLEHDLRVINDKRVQSRIINQSQPVPASPYDKSSFGYQTISTAIEIVFPGIPIVPGIVIATTDSRHYKCVTDNIYRFIPVVLTQEELKMYHGVNERYNIHNYFQTVEFFETLIHLSNE